MDCEIYTPNEVQRINQCWDEYMKLKNYQVKRIYNLMQMYNGNWQQLFEYAKQQIERIINQLPTSQDLIQKANEQKWVNFRNNNNNLQISVHEDLYTYLVQHSKEQKKDQKIYAELQAFNKSQIEEVVFESVKAISPNLCKTIETGMGDDRLNQNECKKTIFQLMTCDDVLDSDVFNMMIQEIGYKCNKTMQNQIKNMIEYVLNILKDYEPIPDHLIQYDTSINIFKYKGFALNPPNISDEFSKCVNLKNKREQSINLLQQQDHQGLFYIKEQDTLMIVETYPKKVAYIINPFINCKELIDNLSQQYKIIKIRMADLQYKSNEIIYLIIQCMMRNEMEYKSSVSQYYEFYTKRHVELCENHYSSRLQEIIQQQDEITRFAKQIDQKFQKYKDILSPSFLEVIKQQKPLLFENFLVNVSTVDYNQMLQQQDDSLGAIIVRDNKILCGFRLKNEDSYVYFLNEPIPNVTCIITKVRQIDLEVAKTYLSLIMSNYEHISKNIKRFLELKPSGLHCVFSLIK